MPRNDGTGPLPASDTKEEAMLLYPLPTLDCTLQLKQVAGDGTTTGSTLWLSSQILACFVQSGSAYVGRGRRAIELGAGTGLVSLVLERRGWQVTATDVAPPLHTVLQPNVEGNDCVAVEVRELDWTTYDRTSAERDPPYDLIVTADTVYQPALVDGLFAVIATLLRLHDEHACSDNDVARRDSRRGGERHALVALERRDTKQVDDALQCAQQRHGLVLRRIGGREVRKAVDMHMGNAKHWPREAWDGVEIWRVDLAKHTQQ